MWLRGALLSKLHASQESVGAKMPKKCEVISIFLSVAVELTSSAWLSATIVISGGDVGRASQEGKG